MYNEFQKVCLKLPIIGEKLERFFNDFKDKWKNSDYLGKVKVITNNEESSNLLLFKTNISWAHDLLNSNTTSYVFLKDNVDSWQP